MKTPRLSLILLLATCAIGVCFADSRGLDEQRRFSNRAELETWAEKNSWGHEVATYTWRNCEVLAVRRAFTSGVPSCSLSFYVKDKDGWIEALRLRPWWGAWLHVRQAENSLRVLAGNSQKEVMVVSISGLQKTDAVD